MEEDPAALAACLECRMWFATARLLEPRVLLLSLLDGVDVC